MKRKIMIIGIVFILIIESIFVYNLFKPNKSQILQDIKTINIFENKDKTLSIMIQQPDYTYKEDTSRTAWPSTSEYLYSGAKCTDKDGNTIVDAGQYISFEETNHTATITTKKTIYCTLYFANGRPALEVLDSQGGTYYAGGTQGNRTAVQGLYRFKGTASQVTNNYICLGADENPDKCKTNPDNMYRIIGVTDGTEEKDLGLKAGMLKVIKATPPSDGTSIKWASSYSSNYDWDNTNATARKYLNETFYTGSTIDVRIKPYIVEVNWWKGDYHSDYPSSLETKIKTTGQYQIGLMYQSDYVNAYQDKSTDNWLFIKNGLTGNTVVAEWTMSRYGLLSSNNYYAAWRVREEGWLHNPALTAEQAVRPVFYLATTTGLIGFGTEQQPYTITTIK